MGSGSGCSRGSISSRRTVGPGAWGGMVVAVEVRVEVGRSRRKHEKSEPERRNVEE